MKIKFNNFEVDLEMNEMVDLEPEVTKTFLDLCIDSDKFANEKKCCDYKENILPSNESVHDFLRGVIETAGEFELLIIEEDENEDDGLDGFLANLM